MNKIITFALFLLLSLLLPLSAFAKSINFYDEPKDNAKVVGSLDSDVGIIPIYTPEKGDWIKVADPRNGNVGWVKMKDLGDNAGTTGYTFTQRFINTGTSPQTYQVIQFGGPNKMTPEQIQNQLKQTKLQQQQMQENMNKAMQNMMNDMNNLYHWNNAWFNNNTPFIMPVLVIPTQNPNGSLAPAKPGKADNKENSKSKS